VEGGRTSVQVAGCGEGGAGVDGETLSSVPGQRWMKVFSLDRKPLVTSSLLLSVLFVKR
jgi:hypothetical protein